jgi:hypothetical protein
MQKIKLLWQFCAPIIVIFLHIPALTRDYFVPSMMTIYTWECTKTMMIIFITLTRVLSFHSELQFSYNDGYLYMQKLVEEKSEPLFKYI